jgi:Nif-specific regulatory protein
MAEKELSLLEELSAEVLKNERLDDVLGPTLRLLSDRLNLLQSTLTLADWEHGDLYVEAAHGFTPTEVRRWRQRLDEGITGSVIQSGKPQIVPDIREDQRFVDLRGMLKRDVDLSFVCVPVMDNGFTVGTLSAYRTVTEHDQLERDIKLLSVVGGLLSPAIKLHLDQRMDDPGAIEDESHNLHSDLIGNSKAMQGVYRLISQVAPTNTTVILRGKSGTGKERVAEEIYLQSNRRRDPFITVNCAALPESVIESELFGHERGAFTGAHKQRIGRFERANKGTIFLDEIGDLSASTQIKLLRVLQEREIERVGGQKTLAVDVRIIAATSRDLELMMQEGSFRQDLYYRLNVFPITLPPLRDRKADILLLSNHFVEQFNRAHGKQVRRISTSAIDMLIAYHWPGNVRELENSLERAVLLARDDVILGHHLPPTLQTGESSDTVIPSGLKEMMGRVEKELILDALKSSRGNMAKAARCLEISERIMGLRVQPQTIQTQVINLTYMFL